MSENTKNRKGCKNALFAICARKLGAKWKGRDAK